ncbi:MAG: hypothetical protein D6733_02955 [Methanobacteriota archaeon]|nr:MAG: hypothetical protein D6733_02955 [Euryarchaeota archaeon]
MICFDLEGPLSPQDNAFEVMKLIRGGGKVFEALSQYDDILALQGREGYEPGDTLRLIVPFLVLHGVRAEDIAGVSEKAGIVPGMAETVRWLREQGVEVRIISTSYEQHAHTIGGRLGISPEATACTRLALEELSFKPELMDSLKRIEAAIHSEGLSKEVIRMLDELYFTQGLFDEIGVTVVGGQRKVDALLAFAEAAGEDVRDVAAVGDSITDYKMLREVSGRGGLSIAFNANQYCLPYGDVGVATVDGRALIPVIEAFLRGGRKGALDAVDILEEDMGAFEGDYSFLHDIEPRPLYTNLTGKGTPPEDVLKAHSRIRNLVRGEAGRLG